MGPKYFIYTYLNFDEGLPLSPPLTFIKLITIVIIINMTIIDKNIFIITVIVYLCTVKNSIPPLKLFSSENHKITLGTFIKLRTLFHLEQWKTSSLGSV